VASLYRSINNLMNAVLVDPAGRWRGRWDRNPASEEAALLLGRERASKGFLPGEIMPGGWTVAVEVHGVFSAEPVTYSVGVDARGPLTEAELASLAPVPPASSRAPQRGPGWYFG